VYTRLVGTRADSSTADRGTAQQRDVARGKAAGVWQLGWSTGSVSRTAQMNTVDCREEHSWAHHATP
jgi:hypothetical protein